MKKALLIIDVLNDFIDGPFATKKEKTIFKPIQNLLKRFRDNNEEVIYINDAHLENDGEFKLWSPHAIVGTKGAQVVDELKPLKTEHIVNKRRYSGFFGTDLELYLREKNITDLVLVGIYTDICVFHTTYDAFTKCFNIEIPVDCVSPSGFNIKNHQNILNFISSCYGAKLLKSFKDVELKK